MSIIVKGMEMPSGCQSCDFSDDEARFCKAAKEYIPMLGKPGFCPLVELPVGHGRLVDAESLDMERLYRLSSSGDGSLELVYTKDEYPTVLEGEE